MQSEKTNKVDLLLSKLDKTHLCEFIKKECAQDARLKERFLALGAGTVFKVNSALYASRVKNLIEEYSGRHGYVEYRDTFDFNRAVCRLLDEADTAICEGQWDVAVAVLSGVSGVGDEIINCGDDSAGELGAILEECFYKFECLCDDGELPEEVKSDIYELSISRFLSGNLKGWDWWWNWIEMAISLAETTEKQDRIIKILDDVINQTGDEWSIRYNAETAKKYKLEIMSKVGSEEDQRKFMYDNVDNPDFRKRLLHEAWDEGNHDEVLRLAKEGVSHDAEYAGLVYDWYQWEFWVYQHNNDKENLLQKAKYFFFNENRFGDSEFSIESMYAVMKLVVPTEEWNNYVEVLIGEASQRKARTCMLYIYVQEKKWNRYMEYLRKNPSSYSIEKAPEEVWELYNDELVRLYGMEVRKHFQVASNRDTYRYGVNMIRTLINHGGKTEADEIIIEQKARKPRRPALIEELSKLL